MPRSRAAGLSCCPPWRPAPSRSPSPPGGGLGALAEQRPAQKLRRALKTGNARTRAAVGEREALLDASREALVVWGRDGGGPQSYGGGGELLQSWLEGADAL